MRSRTDRMGRDIACPMQNLACGMQESASIVSKRSIGGAGPSPPRSASRGGRGATGEARLGRGWCEAGGSPASSPASGTAAAGHRRAGHRDAGHRSAGHGSDRQHGVPEPGGGGVPGPLGSDGRGPDLERGGRGTLTLSGLGSPCCLRFPCPAKRCPTPVVPSASGAQRQRCPKPAGMPASRPHPTPDGRTLVPPRRTPDLPVHTTAQTSTIRRQAPDRNRSHRTAASSPR